MYWLLFNAFMGVCIFTPLQIAKRKRDSKEFIKSDLISAIASITIFSFAYVMTWSMFAGLIVSLAIMIPLSMKSSDPGSLLVSILKKIFPANLLNQIPLGTFFKSNILAKENRTAVAIAIGSAAIVFAILLGNISQNNQPASNGAPQMLRGAPRWHTLLKRQVYDCPAGYRPKGVAISGRTSDDPWCYKEN